MPIGICQKISGTPAELYGHPASPFVAGFFGPPNRFKGWAVGGEVSTPVGPIRVPELEDGTAVDVLIRPEALRPVRSTGGAGCFEVRRIRDLGTTRVLELRLSEGAALTVRMTGHADFEAGERVILEVDPAQVHVYPATTRTG